MTTTASLTSLQADLAAVREFWRAVVRPGDVHEVRAPKTRGRWRGVVSGYFNDVDTLGNGLKSASGADAEAVYVTLNPVNPALLARAANRLKSNARETTAGTEIAKRTTLLIDFDPVRPSGISSTDAERDAALALRDTVRCYLTDEAGWREPLAFTMSGNGAGLLYRVDLPNDSEATALVQRVLVALAHLFDSSAVKVDTANFDANRITKIIGTIAAKGDNLPDRPWRLATGAVNPDAVPVPREALERVAALAPNVERPAARSGGNGAGGQRWDLRELLSRAGIGWREKPKAGYTILELDRCLTSQDHADGAALLEFPSGAVEYKCLHNRCSDKRWADVRPILAPEAGPASTTSRPTAQTEAESDAPDLVIMSTVFPEDVTWLWPGRIPCGKLSLIIGDPGQGKSTATLDLAARVSRGLPWPDGGAAPWGGVVLLTAEDGLADTVRPRLDAMEADVSRVAVLRGIKVPGQAIPDPFRLDEDLVHLETAINQMGARLVVVDPISAYLGDSDSYKDADIRRVLAPLAALAERTGAAVVGVLHLTKDSQRKVLYRAQGSLGFVAASRAVFAVAADKDDPERRLLLPIKCNLGPTPPGLAFRLVPTGSAARVEWSEEPVTVGVEEALAGPEPPQERSERTEAENFLRNILADGPVEAKEVFAGAGALGIKDRTLNRAKASLKIKAEKDGFRGPWLWSLPQDCQDCLPTLPRNGGNVGNLREAEEVEL